MIEAIVIPRDIEDKLEWKHNVTRREVEQVLTTTPKFRFAEKGHVQGENLYRAIGQTDGGRYLVVLFILKADHTALVISARDLTEKERKQYARK